MLRCSLMQGNATIADMALPLPGVTVLAAGGKTAALRVVGGRKGEGLGDYFAWRKGPVRREGDVWAGLELSRATRYTLDEYPNLFAELARVKTADAAVRFVEQFGVLEWGHRPTDDPEDFQPIGIWPQEGTAWQPIAEIIAAAADIADLAHIITRLRDNNVRALRSEMTPRRRGKLSDAAVLQAYQKHVSAKLTDRLSNCAVAVLNIADPPGFVEFAVAPTTLREYCYLSFARSAASKAYFRTCAADGCGGWFVTEDPRQLFCTKQCAVRQRVSRFRRQQNVRSKGGRPTSKRR